MSGAGKTTTARRVADLLGLPFYEMDALAIGPGWSTPPDLGERVHSIAATPGWVFDSWGYEPVRDVMWAAADTILWLDFSYLVVMRRILRRSIVRTVRRERLFGGNRETLASWFGRDHPAWHAAATFRSRRIYLAARTTAPESRHLAVFRLTNPRDLESWLNRIATK
ncbi:MAG: adenylate kinase [Pseudonocardiales bacterium]|nr:adenylate kinase [Pseudonocardiales bacterium]